jgi:hypothetical protein
VRLSLVHLLVLSVCQGVEVEFLVKFNANMTYSIKSKNKLEGDSNFGAWKTRIELILAKNKVPDIVKRNIMETQFEAGKERHHALAAKDEEPSKKAKHDEVYFFYYSALIGSIEDGISLIDSGASRNMTGDHKNLSRMMEKETPHKVELGDNNSYAIKGIGQATIKMESSNSIHLSNVIYILSLKKNILYISCLEEKGDRLAFVDGKFLIWSKYSKIEDVGIIGICEGILYKILGQNIQSLVHDEINPSNYGIEGMLTFIIKIFHL